MDDTFNKVWKSLDAYRGNAPISLKRCVEAVKNEGIELTPEALGSFVPKLPRECAESYFPLNLARFIAELVKLYDPKSA